MYVWLKTFVRGVACKTANFLRIQNWEMAGHKKLGDVAKKPADK
jgi:hypothetical protein